MDVLIALAARGPFADSRKVDLEHMVRAAALLVPECRNARVMSWSSPGLSIAWAEPTSPIIASGRFAVETGEGLELLIGRNLTHGGGGPDVTRSDGDDGASIRLRADRHGALSASIGTTGAVSLYTSEADGVSWLSNLAPLVAARRSVTTIDASVAANFLAFGFDLLGRPLWQGVDRLPVGIHHWSSSGHRLDGVGREAWIRHREATVTDVAHALVDVVSGSTWPGHPLWCDITAGRDSRVVLAAALAGSVPIRLRTIAVAGASGFPETEDVRAARRLATAAGLELQVRLPGPVGRTPDVDLRSFAIRTPGTADLEMAARLRPDVPQSPRPVILSGLGGELGRSYLLGGLSSTEIVSKLSSPSARSLLSDDALALVTATADRVAEELAALPEHVRGMALYLRKMQSLNAANLDVTRFSTHTVTPFWSNAVTPLIFSLPAEILVEDRLPRALVDELAPELAAIPYERAKSTGMRTAGVRRQTDRGRLLASRVGREVGRTFQAARHDGGAPHRTGALDALRNSGAPVPSLVDPAAASRILTTRWLRLDSREKRLFWRLATLLTQAVPPSVGSAPTTAVR